MPQKYFFHPDTSLNKACRISFKKTTGITLLEMIISIAIFAFVAASILLIFNRALFVYRVTSEKNSAAQEAQIAMEWLARDIGSANGIILAGQSDIILAMPNQQYVRYYLDTDNTIKRQECSNPSYLLAENITQFSLKYYDINNNFLNDPVTNILLLKTIEIDITVRKNRQVFRLNSVAKFEYNPNFSWAASYGLTTREDITCVQQVSDGYVLGGWTTGGVGGDFFLIKTNLSGTIEWARTYGGTNSDYLYCLQQTVDASGNPSGYILGGETWSFDAASEGYPDALLIKVNLSGEIDWAKIYRGVYTDSISCLQQTFDKGYILGGRSGSFASLGSGSAALLIKVTSSGNIEWGRTYDVIDYGHDPVQSLQQTSDGYILGVNTSPIGSPQTSFRFIAIKTNASGNVGSTYSGTWAKDYGDGSSTNYLASIEKVYDGGYILGGISTRFSENSFLAIKTDAQGLVGAGASGTTWARTYPAGVTLGGGYITFAVDGGYILAGRTVPAVGDLLLVKTNTSGVVDWAKTYGDFSTEVYGSLRRVYDTNGNPNGYILGGTTESYGIARDFLAVKIDALGRLGCCGIQADTTVSSTPQSITAVDITGDARGDMREYPDSDATITDFSPSPVTQTNGVEFNLTVRRYSNDGNSGNDDFTPIISSICPAFAQP